MSSKEATGLRSLLTLPRHHRTDMWAGVYRGAFGPERSNENEVDDADAGEGAAVDPRARNVD